MSEEKIPDKKDLKKKTTDGSKYIELNPEIDMLYTLSESDIDSVVFTIGRFSPPTIGHEKLVAKMYDVAKEKSAKVFLYTTHSFDKNKNPLKYDDKIRLLSKAFGKNIVIKSKAKDIIGLMKELQQRKFSNVYLVVGSDRVLEFETLLNKYNGKEYDFDIIEVISSGDRDADDEISTSSSSLSRSFVLAGNKSKFKSSLPLKLRSQSQEIFDLISRGMNMNEENLTEARKPLNFAQRRKRSMLMHRLQSRIERARERARTRMASPEKIKERSHKKAIQLLRMKLSPQKPYDQMSTAEKISLDLRLQRIPASVVARIAMKQLPKVRQAEVERLSREHQSQHNEDINIMFEEKFNEDNPLPKKRYHNLLNKNMQVHIDKRFKQYKPKNSIQEEVESLMNDVENVYELTNVEQTRKTIDLEKTSDTAKHKRMLDSARERDKNNSSMRNETYYTDEIVKIKNKHTHISTALADFKARVSNVTSDGDIRDIANDVINSHDLDHMAASDLIKLNSRIENSKYFEKKYGALDATESCNREEGTDSLVKIYKKNTPGQKDINEAFSKKFCD